MMLLCSAGMCNWLTLRISLSGTVPAKMSRPRRTKPSVSSLRAMLCAERY